MQLIIPMSGEGTRFINQGYKVPKPMIKISGFPMIKHAVDMFPGIDEVLFIVNQEHFENKALNIEQELSLISPNSKIAVIEKHKFGPAWAISKAHSYVNVKVPVVVNYCDFTCVWNFDLFKNQLESGLDGLIATYSGFHPHMLRSNKFAYVKLNEQGNLVDIQEKLSYTNNPMSEEASSGTYGFGTGQLLVDAVNQQILNNDSYNGEFYSSLTYKSMIRNGNKVKTFKIDKFVQWGTPEDLDDFNKQKKFFYFKNFLPKNHSSVNRVEILAAGNGRRFFDAGYKENKAFLKLDLDLMVIQAFNSLGFTTENKGILIQEKFDISSESIDLLYENNIKIRKVKTLTLGQAQSALMVLENQIQGPCVVGTCDSLLYPDLNDDISKISGEVLGVWVSKPSFYAKNNPDQFGWVSIDSNKNILKSWVKKEPPESAETYLITGTFIFGENRESVKLLEDFLDSDLKVKNEYYLDSLIDFALNRNWKVFALNTEWFVSLGTPDEYETYKYWEKLFKLKPSLLDKYED
jgi:dTDP-glucose pyrophosphorylase